MSLRIQVCAKILIINLKLNILRVSYDGKSQYCWGILFWAVFGEIIWKRGDLWIL